MSEGCGFESHPKHLRCQVMRCSAIDDSQTLLKHGTARMPKVIVLDGGGDLTCVECNVVLAMLVGALAHGVVVLVAVIADLVLGGVQHGVVVLVAVVADLHGVGVLVAVVVDLVLSKTLKVAKATSASSSTVLASSAFHSPQRKRCMVAFPAPIPCVLLAPC